MAYPGQRQPVVAFGRAAVTWKVDCVSAAGALTVGSLGATSLHGSCRRLRPGANPSWVRLEANAPTLPRVALDLLPARIRSTTQVRCTRAIELVPRRFS
jgi:hypothetical protein